ncbi:uncharacterized protein LOC122869755 isoform X2 [Siniperca chuatsi]|uniref:uncharacterized protein LOC122869755 isoform X2 n=1 Tax=Siniperca chuatsi TaxID=119488 RepID=UPI001CE18E7A|nr:uncharacterized protein LOC122869755 isoform X2 [Siniperca chuatsi]
MNESLALDGVGSLSMENSRLRSITQRWDSGVLAGDRALFGNNAALGVLLGGLFFGVLELILFIFAMFCKKINTRHLTVFKVSLIFTGLLQSLSTPVVAMELVGSTCSLKYCYKLLVVWFASRRCGVLLHLLVALEFILIWKQSREETQILPLHWSLSVVLTLDLICILFFEVTEAAVALGAVAMTLTLVIIVQAFCSLRSMDMRSGQVIKLYDIFMCLTNLRLVADGYLCWVTWREEEEEEAPQQMEAGQVNLEPITQARF